MHIKEICLEGFKSYATRTVVLGFDPYFNAITSLNGSGKSIRSVSFWESQICNRFELLIFRNWFISKDKWELQKLLFLSSLKIPLGVGALLAMKIVKKLLLVKRVNKKVMAMFEKAEDEYNDLTSKKSIIENDKSKIKKVIEELDEKKKETLKHTWEKVNKDFGSIFSTLLPGSMAKLEPPEGSSFLDGLEVRVAFGSVWKQSLSELSGGQRSLLALSLILALLLFKPAPLYMLDELANSFDFLSGSSHVDAALDLSHMQNIGRMIKTHFPHSQL